MHWPARVDIVVVNYHSAGDVCTGLEALGAWPHGAIWVVDNSSDASEVQALQAMASERAECTVIDAGANLGFARACNLALSRSSSEYVLLLNPDARITQAHLEVMLQTMVRSPRLAAVSPATYWNADMSFVLPRPSTQTPLAHLGHVVATWWPRATRMLAEHGVRRTQKEMAGAAAVPVDFLAGAVLLLRRSAVEASGGLFDPGYFMFFEDADLSLRLRRAGYALALLPAAQAMHHYRHKPFKAALMAQSQMHYFSLHHRWYLRLSGGLRGVERCARPVAAPAWYPSLGPLASAQAFAAATGGARVEAFSPSPLMMPAIARPSRHAGHGFTPEEWALLEPGAYVAWLTQGRRGRWVHFVRSSPEEPLPTPPTR